MPNNESQKKPRKNEAFFNSTQVSLIISRKRPKNMKQAQEQVIDADVQWNSRHNIVSLATMNYLAGLVQDHTWHQ